jgi:ascorbate-specific PTS system EIIC-type component UlaA
VYFSIALLSIIFIVLMLFKRGIEAKLPSNNKGAEYVTKVIKQSLKASISLSVIVYLLCIGI